MADPTTPRRLIPFIEITSRISPSQVRPKSSMLSSVSVNTLKRKPSESVTNENIHKGQVSIPSILKSVPSSHPFKRQRVEVVITSPRPNRPIPSEPVIIAPSAALQLPGPLPKSNPTRLPAARPARPIIISPCPRWAAIDDSYDKSLVEDRIQLREFAHRFHGTLGLAKMHRDSLESFDHFKFTEQTCKAYLVALVSLIADDEPDRKSQNRLQDAMKLIKATRPKITLDQMWELLEGVSDCFTNTALSSPSSKEDLPSAIQDELATVKVTRAAGASRSNPVVVHPLQFIPVLASLIPEAIATSFIRQEFDDGLTGMKDVSRDRIAELKEETQRWTSERKLLQEEKDRAKADPALASHVAEIAKRLSEARESHQSTVIAIEVHYSSLTQIQKLRYSSLGEDEEGRVYHALSNPLPASFYSSYASDPLKNAKRRKPTSAPKEAKQAPIGNWAYFVFVWGKRPTEAPTSKDDDGEEADADEERWWCFKDARDIRSLAKWLNSKAAAKDQTESLPPTTASLAKGASTVSLPPSTSHQSYPSASTNEIEAGSASTKSKLPPPPTPHTDRIRPLADNLNKFADFLEVRLGKGAP